VTPPFGKCVWCERGDFTIEHVIGRQFAKAMQVPYPVRSYWGDFELPGDTGEIVLKDRVCDTCNRNWMRKLDDRMMKFMRPAIAQAERVQLDLRKQEILAMWAVKIALLLRLRAHDQVLAHPELAESAHSNFIPDDNFDAIERSKRKPPKRTTVWIGAVDPRDRLPKFIHCGGSFSTFETRPPGQIATPVERGYFELFGLNRVIFYVTGWEIAYQGTPPNIDPKTQIGRGTMQRVWPNTEQTIQWPPQRALRTEHLEGIVKMPADWGGPPQARRRLVSTPQTAES
jgi:hypothetical protein